MERTVPSTASEEIELYLRTIYSLLRSTNEVQVRTLEEVHAGMSSSLHPDARGTAPDTSAFIYSLLRLPPCMPDVKRVIMGQSFNIFNQHGHSDICDWELVTARARRRRTFFDGKHTLASIIASRSDIDDLIPTLVAYQIEWNKLHFLLQDCPNELLQPTVLGDDKKFSKLAALLEMTAEDLDRLLSIWSDEFLSTLKKIQHKNCSLSFLLLSGSFSDYQRATRSWWNTVEQTCPDLLISPVYFVSSNTHSMANILTGYALRKEKDLIQYLEDQDHAQLMDEWKEIKQSKKEGRQENFLYYLLKKYQQSESGAGSTQEQREDEELHGIQRVTDPTTFEIEAQITHLNRLTAETIDHRILSGPDALSAKDIQRLEKSDALILNIDYPLGLAAYNLLSKVSEQSGSVLGVYIMGKSATLNSVRGDVIVPNVVHDEHSQNTYLFPNVFTAADVAPFLSYGSVLDNQKAVTVMGTFLQNARVMDVVYREGYTDIEMEAGPYLSAMYEMFRPKRHPINEIVNLYGTPFEIGILHYASDTPMSKGKNLGAGTLSYTGMDATYAATVAIARRILRQELKRLKHKAQ